MLNLSKFLYATQMVFTCLERILFVIPGYEFCSWIRVGILNKFAIKSEYKNNRLEFVKKVLTKLSNT